MGLFKFGQFIGCGMSLLFASSIQDLAIAQLIPDSTFGAESSLLRDAQIGHHAVTLIEGGATRDSNLFHSFQDFNVDLDENVYFANPAAIANIITRVTGTNLSNIDGRLGVDGNANLYLVNPNGISFGDTATLDIAGSLYATTTKALLFEDGTSIPTANDGNIAALLTVSQPLGLASWLPPQSGAIANRGQLAVGGDLYLQANELDLQNILFAGADLTLAGTSEVKVRDTAATSFYGVAGNDLFITSDAIDLFALRDKNAGLFSGGDMILSSPNPIVIDTYFNANGNFQLRNGDELGSGISPNDPIIRSSGDVSFDTYTGASLHIFAGGSVTADSIIINNADGTNGLEQTVTLSDNSTQLPIDGRTVATLDVRAGTTEFVGDLFTGLTDFSAFAGAPEFTIVLNSDAFMVGPTAELTGFTPSSTPTNANISINSIETKEFAGDHQILLTNQYMPNPDLAGGIAVGDIALGQSEQALTIDSKGDIFVFGTIQTDAAFENTANNLDLGDINLIAQNDINFIDGGSIALFNRTGLSEPEATRKGSLGVVNLQALGDINLEAKSRITSTSQNGSTGTISLDAENVFLDREALALLDSETVLISSSSGDISINANQNIIAANGAQIQTSLTLDSGTSATNIRDAGSVTLNTKNITLDGRLDEVFSGVSSIVNQDTFGNAGTIEITADFLTLENGALILASTDGNGDAGRINLRINETLLIDNETFEGTDTATGIASQVFTEGIGQGDLIDISAKNLIVRNGGVISATTEGAGDSGDISIKVTEAAIFDGFAEFPSGAFTETNSDGGAGGDLAINAGRLEITNGAQLRATTSSSQNAGNISTTVDNDVEIIGANLPADENSGIFVSAAAGSAGNGGKVTLTSNDLSVLDGGRIASDTAGKGNAGDIKVDVTNDITIDGTGSGVFANTLESSTGDGGSIDIDPIFIRLTDGGQFSVSAQGTGVAGDIRVVGNFLILDDGLIDASSFAGSGGNLAFEIGAYILLQNGSNISTNAGLQSGGGDGGNMTITAPFIIALPDQDNNITANAFDGDGGNIAVTTQALLGIEFTDADIEVRNDITVSSELGLDGEFILNSPDADPSSGLAKLITDLGDREDKVVSACATGQELNSFTVTGQGGIPTDPSSLVRGSSLLADMRDFSGGQATTEAVQTAIAPEPESELTLRQATHFKVGENGIELAATENRVPQKVASNCL